MFNYIPSQGWRYGLLIKVTDPYILEILGMLVLFFASCNCLTACSTPGALPLHLLANDIHSRIVHFISLISRFQSQYMFIVCMLPTGLAFYNVQMSGHLQFAWSSALASACR